MYLSSQHRDSVNLPKADFEFHLRRLRPVIDLLSAKDAKLGGDWFLGGSSIADAQRFPVFSGGAVRKDAIDELRRKNADDIDEAKFIGIWNGDSRKGCGGSIEFCIDSTVFPNSIELTVNEIAANTSRLGDYKSAADVIIKVAEIYTPSNLTFGPRKYLGKQVFEDRPSVSWMLYLPHVLTSSQVPEARALIPVVRDGKQQGTIIVSVTDEVFDVNNRAHVKAANDIEIRLADQDLLPRFIDL
ncbi:immunity 52 family protein [Paraburkholderia sp. MMS20-SJTN17]|uniref:Immunity 52 family protein n=1 Tax=Paraburkholderia translucens TaxID=2886945 RepID=A0ABS8KBZ0_9BURK|nr:immunity 52 family protein [Paraburkholderia sp. MMS20-SJTN17]MCC8402238.1 immunity 52 family protein [Paraburkholderia sp. MMS20-SJTN17]